MPQTFKLMMPRAYRDPEDGGVYLRGSTETMTVKALGLTRHWFDDRFGGVVRDTRRYVFPRALTDNDVLALEHTLFAPFSCRCEHDCCGHWQREYRVRRAPGRRRELIVTHHAYENV